MNFVLILILCLPADATGACTHFFSVRIDSIPDRQLCEAAAREFRQRSNDYRSHLCIPQVRA